MSKTGTAKGTQRKDLQPQTQPGDNSRYLRHALDIYNMEPIDISDPKQVEARIVEYFKYCVDHDMKAGQEGLCFALGITRQTFWNWASGNLRSETHLVPVKKAQAFLKMNWEQYMLNGKINPVAGIFLAKNQYGYTDKQELEVKPVSPMAEGLSTPEEIQKRYGQLPDYYEGAEE